MPTLFNESSRDFGEHVAREATVLDGHGIRQLAGAVE
jgi:hypothetical protein